MSDVTRILTAIEQGDAIASEELLPLVYNELRRMAAYKMSSEPAGYGARELAPSLARRLTRLLVLHRYSNLPAQVRIAGWEKRVRTFEELEVLLWPWGTGTARRTPADARAPED